MTHTIKLVKPIEELLIEFEKTKPSPPKDPEKTHAVRPLNLVGFIPNARFDVLYATENNFMGTQIYPEEALNHVFLDKDPAETLKKVAIQIEKDGYGFIIFDAYRPWRISWAMWHASNEKDKHFVATPSLGSVHNRMCAIDLSLYDLESGKPTPMPSDFDEFGDMAYPTYMGGTKEERKNRDYLIKIMSENGFKVLDHEWWHFNWKDSTDYPVLDIPFEKLIVG